MFGSVLVLVIMTTVERTAFAKNHPMLCHGSNASGSATVPMPPAAPPPMQHIQESREYAHRCIGKTRGGDRDGRTRIAPGSARARMQASPQPEYQALARAQREAADSHRLWLDRKYKKRAWKRAWKRQARNVPPPVICLHVIHTIRPEEPRTCHSRSHR